MASGPDTVLLLEKIVGVPAHIKTKLESEYRLTLELNHPSNNLKTFLIQEDMAEQHR